MCKLQLPPPLRCDCLPWGHTPQIWSPLWDTVGLSIAHGMAERLTAYTLLFRTASLGHCLAVCLLQVVCCHAMHLYRLHNTDIFVTF